ncbi:MAG: hypothetical protein COW19_06720 [Zetaproteobacteria bacterium CG12_big_fil_rev_8_21_14_0_65_55_1124]|nr:MAG: hypothetical protein COW19_06720 [Zetaproteobacteria bacterium CG12_big_fil_rev_8_21_14_0_65_55_1124]PJB81440.1 MAG: hypothetical protein CO089_04460 [Zetaproteobacteria bacterium CG_4_9_14_0_8_um_filter_55_31]
MRLRILLLCSLLLGGCAAAAAVAAVPGVLVDRTMGYFKGQDISLALDMQRSLAAVQQGLERMSLHVNVLEPVPDGYAMEFGNGELDGDIHLQRQTQNLTTLTISAHRGLSQQSSVESAMAKEVLTASEQGEDGAHFEFAGYDSIYAQPETSAEKLGWFRPGTKLNVSVVRKAGWLKIKLPSGQNAYIKGALKSDGT